MNQTSPPPLESELLTGLYSEEEKAQILGQIEEAAAANHLTADADAFVPLKRGILFPVLVNVAAVALIVGAWFGADAYFQTRQQGLQLKTDKMFSTESKLLAKVLEDSKNQLAAKNAEIDKIQGDVTKLAQEKADLQKSFEDRVALQAKSLRQEMADALAVEKKRLQDQGLGAAEVEVKLREFEAKKNTEFNNRLDTYRSQVQAEIDQKTLAVTALQARLQSTVSEQEALRKEVEKQTKERESDLKNQLSSQAADIDQLKRERDDLNAFYRQADAAMATVRSAFDSGDWAQTQTAVAGLRQVLAKASASASESVRTRALAQSVLASTLDTAVTNLNGAASKAEANAQVEAVKAQAKKEQTLAALQLSETQKTLAASEAQWKEAAAQAESLKADVDALTAKLADSTAQAADSEAKIEDLKGQVINLQQSIDELMPYRTKVETLTKLFTSSYATAKEKFLATLGSETGLTVFPKFDVAWQDLDRQTREEGTSEASRKRALDDVLKFTSYLQGTAISPEVVRDATERLARSDDTYRQVVDSIQAIAKAGAAEAKINTATTQLYGTVAAVSGTKVVLEPLTKVRPQEGQEVEIRRVEGKKETILGRGKVLTATNQKVELDWTGLTTVPLSGDPAYLVLP
jgi:predicted DNA-binding antitoxin AbrB/MazE fold protein